MLNRRDFVKGGAALVSIGTTAGSFLKGTIAFAAQNAAYVAPEGKGRILILVQLAGGNDGLNTVVPVADPAYPAVRRTIGQTLDMVLPLDRDFGLAPQLTGLKGLWDGGKLAIVRGVGYPDQDYSHFKSMAIWEAGDPKLELKTGWLGRSLDAMESQAHDPFFGFNIGGSTPPELRGEKIPIPSVRDQADYGLKVQGKTADADPRNATLMKLYQQYPANSRYGVLLETTAETALSSAKALAAVAATYKPAVEYPDTSFAQGLQLLAETIIGGLGIRVGHITLGGFDTHNNEPEEHADLMTTLDEGLSAFYADLAAQGRAGDVMVLTWSEFGRRVQENANKGTDHGSASVLFALGDGVRGGFYGDQPSLTTLVDNGNLSFTTDFRSVYATVIEGWLGIPSAPLLGTQWATLGFVA
ncbi:MAG: DUF1501 domain-containing protein [Dehalococcoidia bacterium]